MTARVVVLAGPSGSGKSRLAGHLGLPTVRLDDFYKSAGDPSLPRLSHGANAGLVDWDAADAWLPQEALSALRELCRQGHARMPLYDIARDGRHGWRVLHLEGSPLVVTEGIFAQDLVPALRAEGLLAGAFCLRRPAVLVFWLRLVRDLHEHRKPPLVLVRRGVNLMRHQREVVALAVEQGCVPLTPRQAIRAVAELSVRSGPRGRGAAEPPAASPQRFGPGLRQPDGLTCGPSCLVVARGLRTRSLSSCDAGFAAEVLATHRRIAGWWPRFLGTAPWAAAREISRGGPAYSWHLALTARTAWFARVSQAAVEHHPVPVYVGDRLLPRHVVLVVGGTRDVLSVYDPATGGLIEVTRAEFVGSGLRFGRWDRVWSVVLPRDRSPLTEWTRRAGRRTPA